MVAYVRPQKLQQLTTAAQGTVMLRMQGSCCLLSHAWMQVRGAVDALEQACPHICVMHCMHSKRLPKRRIQLKAYKYLAAQEPGTAGTYLVSIISWQSVPCLFSSMPLLMTFLYPRRYLKCRPPRLLMYCDSPLDVTESVTTVVPGYFLREQKHSFSLAVKTVMQLQNQGSRFEYIHANFRHTSGSKQDYRPQLRRDWSDCQKKKAKTDSSLRKRVVHVLL